MPYSYISYIFVLRKIPIQGLPESRHFLSEGAPGVKREKGGHGEGSNILNSEPRH